MGSDPVSRTSLPGGNSEREPPDPISNSEVKTLSADGSVGSPHVRVGHCQALNINPPVRMDRGFFRLNPGSGEKGSEPNFRLEAVFAKIRDYGL